MRNVLGTTSGRYVEATYETTFERGAATELFLWKIDNGRVRLAGFHLTR